MAAVAYCVCYKHLLLNYCKLLYRLGISKGVYPDFLINAWDNFDEKEESENDRPGQ